MKKSPKKCRFGSAKMVLTQHIFSKGFGGWQKAQHTLTSAELLIG
jgi:hypothetical protein